MKYLKLIYIIPLWIFYFLISMKERNKWLLGSSKGMHVEELQQRGLLGGTFYVTYNPNKKPEREFLTIKEFFSYHLK